MAARKIVIDVPGRRPNVHKEAAQSQSLPCLRPAEGPSSQSPSCGHVSPYVGLIAVVLPRQVSG